MVLKRPVERKVYAGTIGAGVGVTVSEFLLWAADKAWWPGVEEVPSPVAGVIILGVTLGLTFIGGWLAKHDPGVVTENPANSEVITTLAADEFEHEQRLN